MQPYYCTIYSHQVGYDRVKELVKKVFPKGEFTDEVQQDSKIIYIELRGGLFRSSKKLKINYRERTRPSFELTHAECALTNNLLGMMGFVSSLPAKNEHVRTLLLNKIKTLNSEFSVFADTDSALEFADLVKQASIALDALVFAQPHTQISQSDGQHFLNEKLQLILDVNGKSAVDTLEVTIDASLFDSTKENTEDQVQRKAKSESILQKNGIKVNINLPVVVSEADVKLRTLTIVKERVVALALTNLVAFNSITGEQALQYAANYNLTRIFTPKEVDFLRFPTEEKKNHETWKCEGIWTLLWALNLAPDLEFPNHLADLNKVPADQYPVLPGKDPNIFINNSLVLRSPTELLDAVDLYYRMDWACVDARIKGEEPQTINPGVVYERHYALNWLITYRNQQWDDVRTDT